MVIQLRRGARKTRRFVARAVHFLLMYILSLIEPTKLPERIQSEVHLKAQTTQTQPEKISLPLQPMCLIILPQSQIRHRTSQHQIHQTPPRPQTRQTPRDHHSATSKHSHFHMPPRLLLVPRPFPLMRPPRNRIPVLPPRGLRQQNGWDSDQGASVHGCEGERIV